MKEEIKKGEERRRQALARIVEGRDYWALKSLIEEAENRLKSVLTIPTNGESPDKIAVRLIARQEALALIGQLIKAPLENSNKKAEKRGIINTSFE